MVEHYYAGHSFDWVEKFLKAIPKGSGLSRSVAVCIAACIHHQYVYKKQPIFKLSHKTLSSFGIGRRCLKNYLSLFQQAGLIKYTVKKGSSPIVTLLIIPTNYNIINKNNILKYTVQVSNNVHPHIQYCTGDVSNNVQVKNKKQRNPVSKATPEVREPREQGKQRSKQTNNVEGTSKQVNQVSKGRDVKLGKIWEGK